MTLQTKPNAIKNHKMNDAIRAIQQDNMVKLTLSIPKKMRSEFKIATERNNTNMTDVILQYVKQYIQQ
jgi:hypothetical protein